MKNVGMTFAVFPHTGRGISASISSDCPYGRFQTLFPPSETSNCSEQVGRVDTPGGTLGIILQAAKSQGMKIHLGLLLTQEGFRPWLGKNGTAKGWALQQNAVAGRLHELYARDYADTIVGIYTEIEESNSASWINIFPTFATDYLQTISKAAKSLPKWRQLKVWSSPYSVGNTTRHPPPGYVSPRDYGDAWSSIFSKAPDFIMIQGNAHSRRRKFGWNRPRYKVSL